MNTHINIVGGSGFIGTRLCELIERYKTYSFSIIDKTLSKIYGSQTRIADVRDLNKLRNAIDTGCVIVNLAAEHRDDVTPKSLYTEVNVGGAENVCAVAREKKCNILIFTSSVAVYGFAPIGIDEAGALRPFNDYGRTKYEAEQVYKAWQAEDPNNRVLVIIRPTVVFGERNRGNVYNLLRQITSGKFVMIGTGSNRKSIAYVDNVVAFILYSIKFPAGIHIYNYVDKPDFSMSDLVIKIKGIMGLNPKVGVRLPYGFGLLIGLSFDLAAKILNRKFAVSAIRVRKFCSNSVYNSSIQRTDFSPPVPIEEALEKTIRYEFMEDNKGQIEFFSE
jgi:nucleoside-diphosphate-sugar epimerase